MRVRKVVAGLATSGLLAALPSGAAAPQPQITDVSGDANALTMPYPYGGLAGQALRTVAPEDPLGGGTTTPASWGPADLQAVTLSTDYEIVEAVAVPTALRIRVATAERPGPDDVIGVPLRYIVGATAHAAGQECPVFFETAISSNGTATVTVQAGNSLDPCSLPETVTITDWPLEVAVDAAGLTMVLPLDALQTLGEPFFTPGTTLDRPNAWVAYGNPVRLDSAPAGRRFVIGEDLPPPA